MPVRLLLLINHDLITDCCTILADPSFLNLAVSFVPSVLSSSIPN